jgi:hypothetical protein
LNTTISPINPASVMAISATVGSESTGSMGETGKGLDLKAVSQRNLPW